MSMNCVYCSKAVFGSEGITVSGKGPAHQQCYHANQIFKRTFQSIEISELSDEELNDLKDLVLAEINGRARKLEEHDSGGDIELF